MMKRVWAIGVMGFLAGQAAMAGPAVTLYNQDFGVVREEIQLDLKQGLNEISTADTTAHVEPDSVILRDPTGKVNLQVLEQNYQSDAVSQALLLSLYEGKTVEFILPAPFGQDPAAQPAKVQGKIIRSGYMPHSAGLRRYDQAYADSQMGRAYGAAGEPLIEVDGKLQFGLPGKPLFPALTEDSILKPTLKWLLQSDQAGKIQAELCYVTGGMSWQADYNVVSPEKGDVLDLVGWVTMDNQSGKSFAEAKIKLIAGDVSKVSPQRVGAQGQSGGEADLYRSSGGPRVREKSFDEYHMYTLERKTTLLDRETKQVEFVRASKIPSQRLYIYDGAKIDTQRYQGYEMTSIRSNQEYGTQCNPKVWVMREIKNSKENRLGIPLPKGRVRFYRQDSDGQLEFTGENLIRHTPENETLKIYTGDAFDIVGERRRTDYRKDSSDHWVDESFEIKLRNHTEEARQVRVVEHLYRWDNWEIVQESQAHEKMDSQTIEYKVDVAPKSESTLTYSVHYSW